MAQLCVIHQLCSRSTPTTWRPCQTVQVMLLQTRWMLRYFDVRGRSALLKFLHCKLKSKLCQFQMKGPEILQFVALIAHITCINESRGSDGLWVHSGGVLVQSMAPGWLYWLLIWLYKSSRAQVKSSHEAHMFCSVPQRSERGTRPGTLMQSIQMKTQ